MSNALRQVQPLHVVDFTYSVEQEKLAFQVCATTVTVSRSNHPAEPHPRLNRVRVRVRVRGTCLCVSSQRPKCQTCNNKEATHHHPRLSLICVECLQRLSAASALLRSEQAVPLGQVRPPRQF